MATQPSLPYFRYHPDPVSTGSVVPSDQVCGVCGEFRGYVYDGPVYGEAADEEPICPWCIHDGRAARVLQVEFTDAGIEVPDDVPEEILVEVATRTPGFTGWQQEHWLYHCEDAAAYRGSNDQGDGPDHRFECLVCGEVLTYSDEE